MGHFNDEGRALFRATWSPLSAFAHPRNPKKGLKVPEDLKLDGRGDVHLRTHPSATPPCIFKAAFRSTPAARELLFLGKESMRTLSSKTPFERMMSECACV